MVSHVPGGFNLTNPISIYSASLHTPKLIQFRHVKELPTRHARNAEHMTINMYIATCAWLLLLIGYANRKNRRRHVPIMLTGIFLDVALVVYLQITRNAVQIALNFSLAVLQQLHIASATLALVLYFPILYLGSKLVKGSASNDQRLLHIKLGKAAIIFRTLSFGLMFSMWKS